MAQDLVSASWNHLSLQLCCSKASLWLPTALPGHGPGWDGSTSPPSLGLSPGRCPVPRVGAGLVPPGCLLLVRVVGGPWMSDPTLPPCMESPNSGFWLPIPKGVAGFYNSLTCTSAWTSLFLNTISTLNHGCWYPPPLTLNL